MRLLGLDTETTGLDWQKERILELGISLHEANNPVYMDQKTWVMNDAEIQKRGALTQEIKNLTGLSDEIISEFGINPTTAYEELDKYASEHKVDFIVAHNGTNFDKPFLFHELDKLKIEAPTIRNLPWLDTRRDITYKLGEEPKQRSLEFLLMKKRFVPAVSHRALADAMNIIMAQ